jgi:hypothetical protein
MSMPMLAGTYKNHLRRHRNLMGIVRSNGGRLVSSSDRDNVRLSNSEPSIISIDGDSSMSESTSERLKIFFHFLAHDVSWLKGSFSSGQIHGLWINMSHTVRSRSFRIDKDVFVVPGVDLMNHRVDSAKLASSLVAKYDKQTGVASYGGSVYLPFPEAGLEKVRIFVPQCLALSPCVFCLNIYIYIYIISYHIISC